MNLKKETKKNQMGDQLNWWATSLFGLNMCVDLMAK
jgi:hypothetical protein